MIQWCSIILFVSFFHGYAMEQELSTDSDEKSINQGMYNDYEVELLTLPVGKNKGSLAEHLGLSTANGPLSFHLISSRSLTEGQVANLINTILIRTTYNKEKHQLFLPHLEKLMSHLNVNEPESPKDKRRSIASIVMSPKKNRKITSPILEEPVNSQPSLPNINTPTPKQIPFSPNTESPHTKLSWPQRNIKTIIGIAAVSGCLATLALQWGVKKMPNWQSALFTK